MIRVLLAARSALLRAGLEACLRGDPEIDLVAGAAELPVDLSEADVVIAVAEPPAEELPIPAADEDGPAWILMVDDSSARLLDRGLRAGARAVLPLEVSPDELRAAVRAAAAGFVVLLPRDLQAVSGSSPPPAPDAGQPLSARETEVLRLIAEGLANKAIAWRLGISEHTVKFHVASLLGKLNAATRAEAVTSGMRRGLIPL